jgi:hypothetical protein
MYTDQDIANLVARVQQLEQLQSSHQTQDVPRIGLISRTFLTRAFAVWGHYFVASLLIGIAASCLGVILALVLGVKVMDWIQPLFSSIGL